MEKEYIKVPYNPENDDISGWLECEDWEYITEDNQKYIYVGKDDWEKACMEKNGMIEDVMKEIIMIKHIRQLQKKLQDMGFEKRISNMLIDLMPDEGALMEFVLVVKNNPTLTESQLLHKAVMIAERHGLEPIRVYH